VKIADYNTKLTRKRKIPSLQAASIVFQKPSLEHSVHENVPQNDAEKDRM
jgi:hypothetical protein